MKRIIIVALSCLFLLCSNTKSSTVEKTLNLFLKGLQQFDFEIMDSCMAIKPEKMENSFTGPVYSYVIDRCNDIRLEKKEININDNSAIAKVTLSFPDTSLVLASAMQRYIDRITILEKPLTAEEGNDLLLKCLLQTNTDATIKKVTGEINFIKVDAEWKITDISKELVAVIGCNYLEAFEKLQ